MAAAAPKQRDRLKKELFRIASFVDTYSSDQIEQLKARITRLENLFVEFNSVQLELENKDKRGEYAEQIELEQTEFEIKYYQIIAAANQHLRVIVSSTPVTHFGEQTVVQPKIRLPQLNLPTFSGKYSEWLQFKQNFAASINENPHLTNSQKFRYLLPQLKDEALRAVGSLEVTDENYDIAWDILTQRFENKKFSVNSHIRAMFDVAPIVKENYVSLRNLSDTFNQSIRCLKTLGVNADGWDAIVIYLINTRLDPASRREWEAYTIAVELPTLKEMFQFLNLRCNLLESLKLHLAVGGSTEKGKTSNSLATAIVYCKLCKKNSHDIAQCEYFKVQSPEERQKTVKNFGLCYCCLKPGHRVFKCRAPRCRICDKKHHELLHFAGPQATARGSSPTNTAATDSSSKEPAATIVKTSASAHKADSLQENITLLNTAIVQISNNTKRTFHCRALLDSASQVNLIQRDFCKQLGLKLLPIESAVMGIGLGANKITHKVIVSISSLYNNYCRTIECFVISEITGCLPEQTIEPHLLKIPSNCQLADENYFESSEIEILLGVDVFYDVLRDRRVRLDKSTVTLQETLFGWVIGGTIDAQAKSLHRERVYTHCALGEKLVNFWKIEELNEVSLTAEEKKCEESFSSSTMRNEQGRFIVKLPFRENVSLLGESRAMAEKRFFGLERRLQRDTKLREQYVQYMNEFLKLQHMTRANELQVENLKYFMPHHPVLKEGNISTSCRIVFDSSAATQSKLSLNAVLMTGPSVQSELFSILLRFRKHRFVLSADIEKMFRQVLVHNDHRKFQLVLWRAQPEHELVTYVINTLVFGQTSSPYLATRCLKQLAVENRSKFPLASDVIEFDCYVDDILCGTNTVEEAKALKRDLTNIMKDAQFNLRKWVTNDKRILSDEENSNSDSLRVISVSENDAKKTLGILWNPNFDTLQYAVNMPLDLDGATVITKRLILSRISQIYDPLGFLGPVVIIAKLLMQSLWLSKVSWDEQVEQPILQKWTEFASTLSQLQEIRIPRRVLCDEVSHTSIHGFCDSSEKAYGAAIYLRTVNFAGDITVRLLCAKGKVAPLKNKLTLPKLELCGAVLLSRLADRIIKDLKLEINERHFWCDSMVVLGWISADARRWQTFVANRVSAIQALTATNEWHHVKSEHNAADILSRGCMPDLLKFYNIWWQGPDFLHANVISMGKFETMQPQEYPEAKRVVSLPVTGGVTDIFNRYSSLRKLLRITSYCLRFRENCENKRLQKPINTAVLTKIDLDDALCTLVKVAQTESLSVEIRNLASGATVKKKRESLASLKPFVDKNGVIRVGGRLQHAELTFENMHPMILPAHHELTKLIAREIHENHLHCGPQALLAAIRENFWPISARSLVRKIVHSCVKCFRANPKEIMYDMGQLPKERVTPTPVFYYTGCDYAGPYLIRDKRTRGCKTVKCYVCLFVCFATKAIHLELVGNLTTELFIGALRRFVGRRGVPHTIFCDNGTNFVGARNELNEMHAFLNNESNAKKIQNYVTEKGILWKFLPPRAPHFGGLHEAGVKSMKFHLKRIAGSASLVYEEFLTLLVQVEAVLNSRPLCPLSCEAEDLNALTPGHFLIGRPLTAVLDMDLRSEKYNRLSQYQRVQQMVQHFWDRWRKEYLCELQQCKKWFGTESKQTLAIGSMVVVKEDNVPPYQWHLGRVEQLHQGVDGVSRVATIRTKNGLSKRPVKKLCLLPICENSATAQCSGAVSQLDAGGSK